MSVDTGVMKIPKKITPDPIKDSIVELRYSLKYPIEVVIGIIFKALDDSYTYLHRSLPDSNAPFINLDNLFHNELITFRVHPKFIVFNCKEDYISWSNYIREINSIINILKEADIINNYNRIGVRYINEFHDQKIEDITKFNFTFGMPEVKSNKFNFKTEFSLEQIKAIVSLGNKISNGSNQENIKVAFVDVDIIKDKLKINDTEKLLVELNETHKKEKEIFFKLLEESFIQTLNPEY